MWLIIVFTLSVILWTSLKRLSFISLFIFKGGDNKREVCISAHEGLKLASLLEGRTKDLAILLWWSEEKFGGSTLK